MVTYYSFLLNPQWVSTAWKTKFSLPSTGTVGPHHLALTDFVISTYSPYTSCCSWHLSIPISLKIPDMFFPLPETCLHYIMCLSGPYIPFKILPLGHLLVFPKSPLIQHNWPPSQLTILLFWGLFLYPGFNFLFIWLNPQCRLMQTMIFMKVGT